VPTTPPPHSAAAPQRPALPASLTPWLAAAALIAAMTLMRLVYAAALDLRTDEAYYWTWSKESAASFLDHPPMIAWFIRFGTAIFGDTALGVRFAGIVAMLVTQLLLADIVRRVTQDVRAVIFALSMPEAALYYGLLMAKVAPDTALIPFAVAMLWSLVRLNESGDARWWLAAGFFAGLALLSKFTAIMLLPAVAAFMLVPDWRGRWLKSPQIVSTPRSISCWLSKRRFPISRSHRLRHSRSRTLGSQTGAGDLLWLPDSECPPGWLAGAGYSVRNARNCGARKNGSSRKCQHQRSGTRSDAGRG
jgi:hypothetical protein